MSARYVDRDGQPLDMPTWAAMYEGEQNRRVAQTDIGDVSVSTVWLGLNHNFGDGPPLIFETMIFGGPFDQECWRYSTEDEARAGHAHAVELAQQSAEPRP